MGLQLHLITAPAAATLSSTCPVSAGFCGVRVYPFRSAGFGYSLVTC